MPADIELWDVPTQLDLRTGTLIERAEEDESDEDDEEGDDDETKAAAVAFDGKRWILLWPGGVLSDHLGHRPVKLSPNPEAAAFSADARQLACVLDGEIIVIDVSGPSIISRARL